MHEQGFQGVNTDQDVLDSFGITQKDLTVAAQRRLEEHRTFLRMSPSSAPAKFPFSSHRRPERLPVMEIRAAIAQSQQVGARCVTDDATGVSSCIKNPTEFLENMRVTLAGLSTSLSQQNQLPEELKKGLFSGISLVNDMIGQQRVTVRSQIRSPLPTSKSDETIVEIEGVESGDKYFLAIEPKLSAELGINDEWQQAAYLSSCMQYGHVEGIPCNPLAHIVQTSESRDMAMVHPDSLLKGSIVLSFPALAYANAMRAQTKIHLFQQTGSGSKLIATLPKKLARGGKAAPRLNQGLLWTSVIDRITPDYLDCTKSVGTSLAFDADFVPPMEFIAKQGAAEYEDAWLNYLTTARAAADYADAKAQELIDVGLQMDRSIEDAKREVLDICGGELDGSAFDTMDENGLMSPEEITFSDKLEACDPTSELAKRLDVVSLGKDMCYYTNINGVACPYFGEKVENPPACPVAPIDGSCKNAFPGLEALWVYLGLQSAKEVEQHIGKTESLDIFKNEKQTARTVPCDSLKSLISAPPPQDKLDENLEEIQGNKGSAHWYTQQGFLDAVDAIVLDTDLGHHYTLKIGNKTVFSTKPYPTDSGKYVYPVISESVLCQKILTEKGCYNLFGKTACNRQDYLEDMFRRQSVGQTLISIVSNLGIYGGEVKNIFLGDLRPFDKKKMVFDPPSLQSQAMYGTSTAGTLRSERGWVSDKKPYKNLGCRGGDCECLLETREENADHTFMFDPERATCGFSGDWSPAYPYFVGDFWRGVPAFRDDCELVLPARSKDYSFWYPNKRRDGLKALFQTSASLDEWKYLGKYKYYKGVDAKQELCQVTHLVNLEERARYLYWTEEGPGKSGKPFDSKKWINPSDYRHRFEEVTPVHLAGDNNRDRLIATLALSCAANNEESYSCGDVMDGDFVGTMSSMEDAREVIASLSCLAAGIEARASEVILQNVPKVVVDHFQSARSENLYPEFKGASLNALIEISNALEGFKDDAQDISHTLTSIQAQLLATQQQIAVLDARAGISMLERSKSIAVNVAQIAAASASFYWKPLESASTLTTSGTALAFDIMLKEAQADLADEEVLQAIVELQTFLANQLPRFSSAAARIRLHHEQIQNGCSAFELSLKRSSRALKNAYFNDTTPGWNTAMRRRYNTVAIQYQKAFEEARNAAFLARRALEFRLGIDMAALDRDYPRVSAPAQWADALYSLQGVQYANVRGMTTFQDMEHYADAFIGDYVKKLEIFAEDYAAEHAFSQASDTAVLSMKNDLFAIRDYKLGLSDNLLYHSENVDLETGYTGSADGDLLPAGFVGWRMGGCPIVADDQLHRVKYVDAEPQEPCIFTVPISPDAKWDPMVVTDNPFDKGSPGFFVGNKVPSDLPWIGDDPDALEKRPSCQSPEGCQDSGYLYQRVSLEAGDYILSYYDQLYDTEYSVEVVMLDADQEVALAEETIFPDSSWQRRTIRFYVPEAQDSWTLKSEIELRFHPGAGKAAMGLSRFQLVADDYLGNAKDLAYQKTTDTRKTKPIGTNDPDGKKFREKFTYRCIYECPDGDSFEPCKTLHSALMPYRCFYETNLRLNPAGNQADAGVTPVNVAKGNFNYRHQRLGLNIVGNRIKNCEDSLTPDMCLDNGMLNYSLQHKGLVQIRNHYDDVVDFNMTSAWFRDAKALAIETRLGMPMSSADRDAMSTLMHGEFRGRPLMGDYVLRIYDEGDLDWDKMTDIQWFIEYDYWTRHTK
jgi:hypothetical protein